RLALPLGPSNSYAFSTASHGIRRRSAASASRARVKAFSFRRSCSRAASHSCGDTIGGVFIGRCPFRCSISLSLFSLFLLRSRLATKVVMPPIEVAPAVAKPVLSYIQDTSFASSGWGSWGSSVILLAFEREEFRLFKNRNLPFRCVPHSGS